MGKEEPGQSYQDPPHCGIAMFQLGWPCGVLFHHQGQDLTCLQNSNLTDYENKSGLQECGISCIEGKMDPFCYRYTRIGGDNVCGYDSGHNCRRFGKSGFRPYVSMGFSGHVWLSVPDLLPSVNGGLLQCVQEPFQKR